MRVMSLCVSSSLTRITLSAPCAVAALIFSQFCWYVVSCVCGGDVCVWCVCMCVHGCHRKKAGVSRIFIVEV